MKKTFMWVACLMMASSALIAQESTPAPVAQEPVVEAPAETPAGTPIVEAPDVDEPSIGNLGEVPVAPSEGLDVPTSVITETVQEEIAVAQEPAVEATATVLDSATQDLGPEDADMQSSLSDLVEQEGPDEDAPAKIEMGLTDTEDNMIEGSVVDTPMADDFSAGTGILVQDTGLINNGIMSDCVGCGSVSMMAPPMTLDYAAACPAPIYDSGVCSCSGDGACDTGCNSGCNSPCPSPCSTSSYDSCNSCGSSSGCGCSNRGIRGRLNAPCQGKCGCAGGGLFSQIRHRISGDRCRR